MNNGIKSFRIEENNLMATKDLGDFGGPNQWHLWVKTKDGHWDDIQWMNVNKIQQFCLNNFSNNRHICHSRKRILIHLNACVFIKGSIQTGL